MPGTSTPPPPPTSGSGKYIIVAVVLLLGMVGLLVWRSSQKAPDPIVTTVTPPAGSSAAPDPKADDVPPPPPPEPDAGPATTKVSTSSVASGCESRTCSGATTSELESALAFRAKQSHRCYDQALTADTTLKGKVGIAVRVGSNGTVCSVNVASNDLGTPSVAQCVAGYFRSTGHFPAPKGGCVDTNIPISFVPSGR